MSQTAAADDFAPTSAEARLESWRQHQQMQQESPLRELKWELIGPELQSGRIECIAAHPTKPSVLYVGVGSGGLWKSVNNGISWTPIFDQQASAAIGDVALDPQAPETIWLGTGEVLLARSSLPGIGIFRSNDGGRSWEHMGLEDTQHVARVLVHPNDSNTVYVAAIGHQNSENEQRGVFRTQDGGKSWERVLYLNEQTAAIDLVMHPANPNILYASLWGRPAGSKRLPKTQSGIYQSLDGGDHWHPLQGGLPTGPQVGRIAIALAASNPDQMYALADEGDVDGFYRSFDAGKTWTRTYDALQARWDWCEIRVSSDNADEVYSIGQNSFVTRDGGKTFEKIAGDIVHLRPHGAKVIHLDTHAMWINPNNSDHLLFGTDGGLFQTYDRCKTWLHLNNMPIAESYAVTYDLDKPFNVYVGTQDNAALFGPVSNRPRVDEPDAWKHVYLDPWGGGDSYFTYRDPTDRDFIYYEHQFGALRRKNMRTGKTVNLQPRLSGEELRFAWMTPFFPSAHDGGTLYYAANRVFKSEIRGEDWQVISDNLISDREIPGARYAAITTLAESPLKVGLLYAGSDRADLWMTQDDGKTWNDISRDLPHRSLTRVHASPHDPQRVFVTQSGAGLDDFAPYVFRSDDQGRTWTNISKGLPLEPVNVIVEDPHVANLLYVGTDMGVYASQDGGKQWISLSSNLPTASVYDLFVHPRDNILVIGTHGRSCFAVDAAAIQALASH